MAIARNHLTRAMAEQGTVLLTGNACVTAVPEWNAFAKKHDLKLVQSKAESPEQFLDHFNQHNIIAIANNAAHKTPYTDSLIDQLPANLLAICHAGAGYDYVGNVSAWKKKGIQVSNTPDAGAISTADTALYLTIGSLRNFSAFANSLRKGEFRQGIELGVNSTGRTLGIIGLGGIGALARDKIAAALDFERIVYHNRRRAAKDVEKESEYVDLDNLLRVADVILIVVPLTESTHHLVDAELLKKTKPGLIIVNVSRGAVIDEHALVDALETGHVRTVGLDVFENEPKVHPKLVANHDVLLLPHCGGQAVESQKNQELHTIDNIESLLTTGKVKNLVSTW